MTAERRSFLKTIGFALGALAVSGAAGWAAVALWPGLAGILAASVAAAIATAALVVAAGGAIVLWRDAGQSQGRGDLFVRANRARSEASLERRRMAPGAFLKFWRAMGATGALVVGDVVEVRSLAEIRATLDAGGALDGLPFMAEMERFAGKKAVVFRSVDKIYDYGRSRRLRRLDDAVLLTGFRCDGAAHGRCEAACYLLWKGQWLKRSNEAPDTRPSARKAESAGISPVPADAARRYECQYTQLTAASGELADWDVRQDLRPLLAGNLTLAAWAIALLTRTFNWAQVSRGGAAFPVLAKGDSRGPPGGPLGLAASEAVRVRTTAEIARTLDASNRNRGLWFDREMTKRAGQPHTVLGRVERLIDINTGQIVAMRTPCIVLEECDGSGELLRFCAQHEYMYWREAWLQREPSAAGEAPARSG